MVPALAAASDRCEQCAYREAAVAAAPAGARVAVDPGFTAHLTDRNPVNLAVPEWTDSTGVPLDSQWVLLDESSQAYGNLANGWERRTAERLVADGYEVVARHGPTWVLRRP
ncbi:MAG: hypothetical protein LBI84_05430 [Propionibacteriaceae bacterium]|nr:hypothetical protein [Propionibacteriaceae bacterium]